MSMAIPFMGTIVAATTVAWIYSKSLRSGESYAAIGVLDARAWIFISEWEKHSTAAALISHRILSARQSTSLHGIGESFDPWHVLNFTRAVSGRRGTSHERRDFVNVSLGFSY